MIKKLKKLIIRINKSKDGKILASNFGFLALLKVASYIFPLVTIPYLARVIGVEGFGKIAFAAAVVIWFQTISDWGFNYTATRDVAKNRDNLDKVSTIFSNVLWARIFLACASLIILLIAITAIPYFKENQKILLVTFLLIPGHILFPDWFFQAMERMKYITIFDLFSKAIFTALVLYLIKEKSDFILQPLFISLGYLISGAISMYIIIVKWGIKIHPPKIKTIFNTINKSTDVFLNNILPNLYNSLAIVLLGFWGGPVANGIYDAGRKFISITHSFMDIAVRATFPFLSRKIGAHSMFASVYLSVAALCSLILFFISPVLIKFFFTEEFHEAIIILKISSISIFLIALSKTYGINYLIIIGYEKELRKITLICSLIGFILSIPLVYKFHQLGAAITLVFIQIISGFWIMQKARTIKANLNN